MRDGTRNRKSAVLNTSYYDRLWPELGRKLHYTEVNRARFISESIAEFVGRSGLAILDFGCGRGWMSLFLSPFGTVTGVDFSPVGIEFAREHYGEHAEFVLADTASPTLGLPADGRFDVVVCSEVIEHVPDHLALLDQISGFLRPGGWCMLTTPNGNVWPQFSCDKRFISGLQPVEHWLTTEQIKALFGDAGYRIVRHEGRALYDFRKGPVGWLQFRFVEKLFEAFGMGDTLGRLVLPTALYQVVAARI